MNSRAREGARTAAGMPNPIVRSDNCITVRIGYDERKNFQSKLESDHQTGRMLKEIQDHTSTRIEYHVMKDGSIDFIIYGKQSYVQDAKQLILKDFQAPVTLTVAVPKAIHGKLLGPKGVRLLDIQTATETKINVPRQNEDSEIITIVGLKSNAERAVERIQQLAKELAAKSQDRITVERRYLLFITGPFNDNIKQWEEKGVKVSILSYGGPNGTDKDLTTLHAGETTFTLIGEASAVQAVKDEIRQVYEEKKKKCTTVNIEVKKAQHKYITGSRGDKLRTFFAKTGVSVEMPPPGTDSDTITLRGEQSKIGPALSELYSQAHSETDDYFIVENWLHKFLIGPRRVSNTFDFKQRGVSVQSFEDRIKLHGSPGEVELAKDWLEAELPEITKRIMRKDIKIEPRLHGFIIGRSGGTVNKIREETGAYIHVPDADDVNDSKKGAGGNNNNGGNGNNVGIITLEGTSEAIAAAELKISSIAKKYEAQRKLIVPHAIHGMIIGRNHGRIKEIKEKFNSITINFPDAGVVSDEINLLGPKEHVDNCYEYLRELANELSSHTESQVTIPVKLQSQQYLGRDSRIIRQLLDEFEHKIALSYPPKSSNNSKNNNSSSNNNTNNNTNSSSNNNTNSSSNNNTSNNTSSNNNSTTSSNNNSKDNGNTNNINGTNKSSNSSNNSSNNSKNNSKNSNNSNNGNTNNINGISNNNKGNKNKKDAHNAKSEQISGGANVVNSDIVKIRGPGPMVEKARERLQQLAKECQDRADRNYETKVSTKPEVLDKMSYLERSSIHKLKEQFDVKIIMPERRPNIQVARFVIVGIEKKAQAAAQQLELLLKRIQDRVEESFSIPSRAHAMLIGTAGRKVKDLMEQYKVEVRFARQEDADPDKVTLSGHPDGVAKAKAYMINRAESCMRLLTNANNETPVVRD